MSRHEELLREAIHLAIQNRKRGARPFGAVLAIDGEVISTGVNDVVRTQDPSIHAELEAIRAACRKLGRSELKGSVVYASGHPCPMCLAALVMTGVDAVYYAFDNQDAAPFGYSSETTYQALRLPLPPTALPFTRLDVGYTPEEVYGDSSR